jgi:hypothetical protein
MFNKKNRKVVYILLFGIFAIFLIWQFLKVPQKDGNWQEPLSLQAHAEFNENFVTIKNIRNFRYSADEKVSYANYYNQTYDLNKIYKVWYIVEPFKDRDYAAHTFLSFEFSDEKYITISIEARKLKGQEYSIFLGMLKTYPLMYIASDERDSILMRANIRKNKVYLYPVKINPEQARVLFKDMLVRMNDLSESPKWYNTFTDNCTSAIAGHINKIWPGKLPKFLWQSWVTGYAEKLAFEKKLLDTDLDIDKAREKYYVTDISQEIGDVSGYSKIIRQFDNR